MLTTSIFLAQADNKVTEIFEKFGILPAYFIAQVINVIIVFALLYLFAFKPVLAMLEQRRKTIADAQANSEKIREELASTEKRIDEMLQEANGEANKMISDAKESADKVGEQHKQQAIQEAQSILEKAAKAAEAERAATMTALKADFGRLVVATTSKVTGKELTGADQERISKETAAELAQ